ncbi:kinetochore-associated Ndc80 complex subunit ndc80 [Aspergillus fumigatus]|uniref:Kinetochore protein NDC80 n=1 Tax=Aspergillus fumigatus TaxID=746128 RepID=A0A9P8SU61_ASPFM|nr:kinetochore-associated Ndc80 complex subunit ndc80 [Aspergillus fumigatus]KAH1281402.1 kinetochore-associated Ndc80 complex subunit ndc80 [Aspergillus fumigatus]KAH1295685.1 kinetochore-associated Ndc80 complex subunit ndc80 [Aspergillus fumigatus]KAH1305898.1 kinetochore-associated Ndc80 complex subunit ndc80 [Aspergillus fumigatus]KAH1314872.1 kinetochore-associated Ndc80 complex subunit ndc80 [Aspergillus fumigatus]
MSQDTGLFSIRRPRETLGSVQNYSALPQPSSALKRTSSIGYQNPPFTSQHTRSMSLLNSASRPQQPNFQRSSSGGAFGADAGLSSVRRSVSSNIFHGASVGRPSYAPGSLSASSASQSLQRRSSVFSRPSVGGPMGHQSFFTQVPNAAGVPRDPRPLRDRSFQARIGQELLEYLTHNNFELEMKHSLGQNTLRSPTQKDFNYIFQFLYHRIDPGYRFQKSMDAEVPPILKQLRYPFEKGITKSQIAAVGGQNWPTFLGMLHWLMQLAQMMDRFVLGEYDEACAEMGVDVSGDRIIFRFLTGAYHDWLQGGEDEDDETAEKRLVPHIESMAQEFERGNEKYMQEMQVLEAENRALRDQIEELEKNAPDMAKLDKHFRILEDDKRKFEDYNQNVQGKIEKYENRIKFLEEEIQKVEAELQAAEEERSSLQSSVDQQGITIQDIDRMNTERDRLQKSLEDTTARLEETHARVMEKEAEASRKLEDLEEIVKVYNTLGYQTSLIPSTAVNAKGQDYELSLNINDNSFSASQIGGLPNRISSEADRLLAEPFTGYHPAHLLNLDLRGMVRSSLQALRKEINERRKRAIDDDLERRNLLDNIKEAMDEKRSEVEALEHKRRAAEEEFERLKEITTTQKLASDAQIEKMEKELAKMRATLSESVQLMEQREMNTNIEYEQLTLRANALREELHTNVESMLNDVIRFKVHIQKGLEDYESFVVDEVEQELGGDLPATKDVTSQT